MTWDLVVVGAGAAGLMAAARSASLGHRTLLLEKNRQPGVKILMSGGTRCNITHDTDNRGIVAAYGKPGRFLHSALAALGVRETLALFHAAGVATKVEDHGKIFPVSDQASDVLDALVRQVQLAGCQLQLEQPLLELTRADDSFQLTTPTQTLQTKKVLLTTGGVSYPGSGTTGDGYRFAKEFGHSIVTPRPALTPVQVNAPWVPTLKGLTIPDVRLRLLEPPAPGQGKQKPLDERRGSFLFAHFGLSGPVALDISGAINRHVNPRSLLLEMDFLPTVELPRLTEQLQQEAIQNGKKQLSSVLGLILPRRLVDTLLTLAGIDSARKMAELSKSERQQIVQLIKQHTVPVLGTLGFKKAEVTAGGVALDEVNSSTLQSKLAPGLYLAGEVLDLDGPIGGYNFQAAWSTGWLAGEARD